MKVFLLVVLFVSFVAQSKEFIVSTVPELRQALELSADTNEQDIIIMEQGDYFLEGNTLKYFAFDNYASLTIKGGHSVIHGGGARIIETNRSLKVENLTFKNGAANGVGACGGAIKSLSGLTVNSCVFMDNYAQLSGGAIYSKNTLLVQNSRFTGNTAEGSWYDGGGAIFSDGFAIIQNSIFKNNRAANSNDAGMDIKSSWDRKLTIINSIFDNSADEFGIMQSSANVSSLRGTTIVENSLFRSPLSSSIEVYDGRVEVINSIFIDVLGDVVSGDSDSTLQVSNSYLDISKFNTDIMVMSEKIFFGSFNLGFLNIDDGDYRLTPESDLIDKGVNTVNLLTMDLAGNPRVSFNLVDVGPYEYLDAIQTKNDLNGDGKSDILWRSYAKGWNFLWTMDGIQTSSVAPINVVPEPSWDMVGQGDYDADGKSDIFWRNRNTGQNFIYQMNGSSIKSRYTLNYVSATDWIVAGSGDFDGDGTGDLMWRNINRGDTWFYLMNNGVIGNSQPSEWVTDLNYQVAAIGDIDGDGDDDVIWRNGVTGANDIWLMQDGQIAEKYSLNTANSDWNIAGSGDLDGDGTDDIILRNQVDGRNWVYFMENGQIRESTLINTVADTNWEIANIGDYDGDGKADFLWRHAPHARNLVHLMNGTAIKAKGVLRPTDNTWRVAR